MLTQAWTPYDVESWNADAAEPEAVLAALRRGSPNVDQLQADFADPDAPAMVIEAARNAFGHVDILVVNHTRSGRATLYDTTASELDAFLQENVRASILLVKEFAMQHDGRPGGRVVLMTSGQHISEGGRRWALGGR